ncbi:MAG: PQQ-dependent sugar dehydrogenase [Nitrososphaeraceae archaeon]
MSLIILLTLSLYQAFYLNDVNARPKISPLGPTLIDTGLKVELVLQGLKAPTSMSFLGVNDILVTEKNYGLVQRIVNGAISKEPLIHVEVSKADERGLLEIALSTLTGTTTVGPRYVFLYYTSPQSGEKTELNNVYRYELVNGKLTNPKLLLELPASPGPQHNGGKLIVGPDNNLYIAIGDIDGSFVGKATETIAQNYLNGTAPDGRAGILRITQDGKPVSNGIISGIPISSLYYAYGIKNIFGLDFDPITKKMWYSENGPTFGDEINLIEPGFNSGWSKIQGIWFVQSQEGQIAEPEKGERAPENPQGLVDFGGKGKYSAPEFTWDHSVAPTALRFLNSSQLGPKYENDMFVGDAKYGNIYHFKLDQNRTGLNLDGPLADKVADKIEDLGSTIFAKGFGVITDLQVSPDGNLYVLI